MKDIENKLDGFEQVLSILIKKISTLEGTFTEERVRMNDTANLILRKIQEATTQLQSADKVGLEIVGIRKRIETLLCAPVSPRSVTLNFWIKSILVSGIALVAWTTTSLVLLKSMSQDYEQLRKAEVKYAAVQRLAPNLAKLLDSAYTGKVGPSIDSLQRLWLESVAPASQSKSSIKARNR